MMLLKIMTTDELHTEIMKVMAEQKWSFRQPGLICDYIQKGVYNIWGHVEDLHIKTLINDIKKNPNEIPRSSYTKPERRNMLGEAYMMCRDCGAKLYSFDGGHESDIRCPYKKNERRECIREFIENDHKRQRGLLLEKTYVHIPIGTNRGHIKGIIHDIINHKDAKGN